MIGNAKPLLNMDISDDNKKIKCSRYMQVNYKLNSNEDK